MLPRVGSSILAALLASSLTSSASAQVSRTWVSGVGDDTNPCSRTAPCKTFAGAISKTVATGTISVLDPGGYGTLFINKSITIDGNGTNTSIINNGTDAVIIDSSGTPTTPAVVVLRGLAIFGIGAGLNGIRFAAGKSLTVESCTIQDQQTAAITFAPATAATLSVRNSTFSGNKQGVVVGVASTAVIATSRFFDDVDGVVASGTSKVSIWDSVFSNNTHTGLWAKETAEINMDRGLVSDNGVGAQGDSTIRLSDVMLAHNTTGIAGAHVVSYGNNRVTSGNGTDGAPSGTLPQQ